MKIFSIRIGSQECGPSTPELHDQRTEIFFAGCLKALQGNPCKECFNQDLWRQDYGSEISAQEILEYIQNRTDNKYVSIVGGEPLDQPQELIQLCRILKENNFHIVLFSHYLKEDLLIKYPDLFCYIDILIDGEYENDKRIFDTDPRVGVYHVVGSSNQHIWYIQRVYYYWQKPEILSISYRNITKEPENILRECYAKAG